MSVTISILMQFHICASHHSLASIPFMFDLLRTCIRLFAQSLRYNMIAIIIHIRAKWSKSIQCAWYTNTYTQTHTNWAPTASRVMCFAGQLDGSRCELAVVVDADTAQWSFYSARTSGLLEAMAICHCPFDRRCSAAWRAHSCVYIN